MRRTGIDVTASRCLLVEAEVPPRPGRGRAAPMRIYDHEAVPNSGRDDAALSANLKSQVTRHRFASPARVNLWDLPSAQQYLLLPAERADEFQSIARARAAAALNENDADLTVAIVIGSNREFEGRSRTEVSFVAARTQDIRRRVRPLIDAGVAVEGITTPCGALWSQARLRRPSPGGQVHAYVALTASRCALGIFSSGTFLYGRDVHWGYGGGAGDSAPPNRDELSARLTAELRQSFLYVMQYWDEEVSQVILCGDVPEIRSLIAPLIERLGIEVETLDTLEGIEPSSMPDAFGANVAGYRIACSIVADSPPANLLPAEFLASARPGRLPLLAAAGTAAAVGICAFLYGQAGVARAEAERQIAILERDAPFLASSDVARPRDSGASFAHLLAAFANGVPDDVVVKSLRASSEGDTWAVEVNGMAVSEEAGRQLSYSYVAKK